MLKKIIIAFLIPAFLLQVVGCYSEQWISKEKLKEVKGSNIRVITNDNNEYNPNSNNWFVENDTLTISNSYYIGSERIEHYKKIPLASIKNSYIDNFEGVTTGFIVFGIFFIVLGIAYRPTI